MFFWGQEECLCWGTWITIVVKLGRLLKECSVVNILSGKASHLLCLQGVSDWCYHHEVLYGHLHGIVLAVELSEMN